MQLVFAPARRCVSSSCRRRCASSFRPAVEPVSQPHQELVAGYPDLVAVGGTILNQTGQAVEVVAIWMVIYLGISLIVSGLMNWFNAKMALVER
ncbi:putative amino acid ABC transporter [Brucella abortus bv. 6 str. 870]|nr:putative amino acid ABC transporter [Brucella abortus]AIJ63926.1 putative amino acid ABC transporter [Brucella abortus bv. 6 str. 870]